MFGQIRDKETDRMDALIAELQEGQELRFIIHGPWSGGDALIQGKIISIFQNTYGRKQVRIHISEVVGNNTRIVDNQITLSPLELVGYLQEKDTDLEASIMGNRENVAKIIEDGIRQRNDLRLQQERKEIFNNIEKDIPEIGSVYDATNPLERAHKLAIFRELEKNVKSGKNYKDRSAQEEEILSKAILALNMFVEKERREGRQITYETIVLD